MSITSVADPTHELRRRLVRALRDADRRAGKRDRTRRLREVIGEYTPWWDWGHRLMALVGRDDNGSWGSPRARDLYIRCGEARAENRHAIPDTATQWTETTRAMTAWEGVARGEEWKTFDWQDGGQTLLVGWLGEDGRVRPGSVGDFQGELERFRRWFIWESWVRAEWFGLRRRLYRKGLHAAVHQRIPGTCQATPPRGSGGYDHWYCRVRVLPLAILRGRRAEHPGEHRYRNYSWVGGPTTVEYAPEDTR